MNLILRADDVGYTHINNLGVFKAIDEGLVTSADLMLDCPGFEEAVEFLRERPWISVGWHAHFWGRPVLDPSQVPTMVNEEGRFKFRRDKSGALKRSCDYQEVLAECRAQLERVTRLLGRAPDYTHSHPAVDDPFESARLQACREFGIPTKFCFKPGLGGGEAAEQPAEAFRERDIFMLNQLGDCYRPCYAESYAQQLTYDPVGYLAAHTEEIMAHRTVIAAWHPGYLDEYIMAESSLHVGRIIDIQALCSAELRRWVKDSGIRLVNYRDALYGTNSFQNHLRLTNSELYMEETH